MGANREGPDGAAGLQMLQEEPAAAKKVLKDYTSIDCDYDEPEIRALESQAPPTPE